MKNFNFLKYRKSAPFQIILTVLIMTGGFYFFDPNWMGAIFKGVLVGSFVGYTNYRLINKSLKS